MNFVRQEYLVRGAHCIKGENGPLKPILENDTPPTTEKQKVYVLYTKQANVKSLCAHV